METSCVTWQKGGDNITLTVCSSTGSAKIKAVYNLAVETEYAFSGVSDNDTFYITREKIDISPTAAYDRLFVTPASDGVTRVSENHRISEEKKMKRLFAKEERFDFVGSSLIFSSTLIIILIGVGIRLTSLFGWKLAAVYFPLAILFVIGLNLLTDKLWGVINKKLLKTDDEKTEFYRYFENDFIREKF